MGPILRPWQIHARRVTKSLRSKYTCKSLCSFALVPGKQTPSWHLQIFLNCTKTAWWSPFGVVHQMSWWQWLSTLQVLAFYELGQQLTSCPCLSLPWFLLPCIQSLSYSFMSMDLFSDKTPHVLSSRGVVVTGSLSYFIVILCLWFPSYISIRYLTLLEGRWSGQSRGGNIIYIFCL